MKDIKDIGYIAKGMIVIDLNKNRRTVTEIIIKENIVPFLQFDDGQYLYTKIGWEHFPRGVFVENSEDYQPNEIPENSILLR